MYVNVPSSTLSVVRGLRSITYATPAKIDPSSVMIDSTDGMDVAIVTFISVDNGV
jgi:hypothetical protein